ncbi:putative membrane protein [Dickeya phage vB_DsoM_JA13]|uniref:Putative membrane protein n=1 Tax=Dickeya phage vB_DsoM_JA13 TaxID=2283030 RepID=A0A384ZW09_9CAUD|nr:putative membrane protein [Dickeya phage vB_DsoM_JA13]
MFNKNEIDKLVLEMDLGNIPRPTDELVSEVLSHGKTRVLSNSGENLDPFSKQFFAFCWTQVGRFGFNNLNAVEIGYLTHIQPFYIACAISRYGMDWGTRFLHMKRITSIQRSKASVIKFRDNYFSVLDLERNLNAGHSLNNITREYRGYIKADDVSGLREAVANSGSSLCMVFAEKPIFRLPTDDERKADEKPKRKRTPKGDYNPRYSGVDAEI